MLTCRVKSKKVVSLIQTSNIKISIPNFENNLIIKYKKKAYPFLFYQAILNFNHFSHSFNDRVLRLPQYFLKLIIFQRFSFKLFIKKLIIFFSKGLLTHKQQTFTVKVFNALRPHVVP